MKIRLVGLARNDLVSNMEGKKANWREMQVKQINGNYLLKLFKRKTLKGY